MGNYNPHAPYILGHEWVPIRQADYPAGSLFASDQSEVGYTFSIDHDVIPVTGAFYVAQEPPQISNNVVEMISVYPADTAHLTGPIQKVVIPVSAVSVTGIIGSTFATVAQLLNPSDGAVAEMGGGSISLIGLKFAVENYAQTLQGKRILGVRLAYTAAAFVTEDLANIQVAIGFETDLLNNSLNYQDFLEGPSPLNPTNPPLTYNTSLSYVDFADVNPILSSSINIADQTRVLPWRYTELLQLSTTAIAANSLMVVFDNSTVGVQGIVEFGYAALEVFYCEETRVRYGGRRTNGHVSPSQTFVPGQNVVPLVNTSFATGTTLSRGSYLITQTHRTLRSSVTTARSPHILRGIRELYPMAQIGTVLRDVTGIGNVDGGIGEPIFDRETTAVLPAITLHSASAIVTGSHPYAEQLSAPVYGTITATQRIRSAPGNPSATLDQVRYYARRFGSTSAALLLTGPSTSASITPEQFDSLVDAPNNFSPDGIVDGWREVTLDLVTSIQVTGGTSQDWTWSATGELLPGNRWEILGTKTASVSGTFDPKSATYLAPDLTNVALTWRSPSITGTAIDPWADATLLLAQDPPMVTGFAIAQFTQAVTGTGGFQECGLNVACIPAGITYNRLTWTALGLCDTFTGRTNVSSWDGAESGQSWTLAGTAFDVTNGVGTITPNATGVDRIAFVTLPDIGVARSGVVDVAFNALPVSGTLRTGIIIRMIDTNNFYTVNGTIDTAGALSLQLNKRVANVLSTAATVATGITVIPGSFYRITTEINGSLIKAKIELRDSNAYTPWQLIATDTDIAFGTQVGAYARNSSAVITHIFSFDNFNVTPLTVANGTLEIQRRDSITDWQTIMLSTNPGCVGQFNDFEARVNITSDYRIRLLNALDFAGPWVTGSGMIPTPGLVMASSRDDGNAVLMFTSNVQSSSNLAYIMQFEGTPIEQFVFPEADTVSLQRLFGRDFFIAIRPLERGGERFSRIILVNAAAIPIPSLANFRSLRDLAWADLDYVCVRDELGNRWFATIIIPDGEVRGNRTVYLARIDVIEVTNTPTPVDS